MDSKHLCKITAGEDELYLLSTEVMDEENRFGQFSLSLCDGSNIWSGLVTAESLKTYSKNMRISYEELLAQTRKALTNDKTAAVGFIYEVSSVGKNVRRFTWKRYEEAEDIKFKLGSADLHQGSNPSEEIFQMFDCALDFISTLETKVSHLEHDNKRLRLERDSDIQRLNKLASSKDDVERELYSKFVVVLNDKKARIRDLQEQLNALNGTVSQGTSIGRNNDIQASSSCHKVADDDDKQDNKKRRLSADHDSCNEYSTDEEPESSTSETKKKGKSEVSVTFDCHDLAMLEDDADSNDLPVVTRRRRGQTKSNKQQNIITKPSVPKPANIRSPSLRTKKHPEVRRSGSAEDDTCNLMDDI
ncbi:hypothetical protein LSH36_337g01048 [Paralvinella palmiformis]|uniref:XRCC4 n=1 Tax=Paralvinella palmiformis TaxID=53620 RepID=A0AAD9N1P8_9ANNE|nr:hypothetical protein LSH36_337g01048 [Paralvinella palmiformis]